MTATEQDGTDPELRLPAEDEPLTVTAGELRALVESGAVGWGAPEGTAEVMAAEISGELRRMYPGEVARWPESPRVPGPPEPESLPLDAFPIVLRDLVTTVSRSVQVDPAMAAGIALAAVSAAVADRADVWVDRAHRSEPTMLYIVVVAPPGSRKSAVYRTVAAPLREWELAQLRSTAPARARAVAIRDARAHALTQAQRGGSDDEIEAAVFGLEEAEEAIPPTPKLLADDATPEALVRQMAEHGRVAVMSPEGGPLRILDGRYSDGAARLEEIAKSYDRERIASARIGREEVVVEGACMTWGVMLQPSVLASIRNGRSMRGQGIFGRISWIVPESRVGTRVDSSEAPPLDMGAVERYQRMLRRLLEWEAEYDDGTPVPHRLRLSDEATAIKRDYHVELEREKAAGGRLHGIIEWAEKTQSRAMRIAALLELAARADEGRPYTDPISGWAMKSGVRICRALTTHALAIYGEMEADRRTADLRYLLRRLRELPAGTTESELRRAVQGRTSIEGAEEVAELVDELEERGCVRRVARAQHGPGRPPSPRLDLHPAIARTDRANIADTPPEGGPEADIRNIRTADADGIVEIPELLPEASR